MTVLPTFPATSPYPNYRGLRFEEDVALEQMIRGTGLTVPDAQGNPLPVNVYWANPEREYTKLKYPAVLLAFLGIFPRRSEEERGFVPFGTAAYSGNYLDGGGAQWGDFPVPVTLRYQAQTLARNIQHDIIINDTAFTTWFPMRFGQLNCPSGTVRRLDFESMFPADTEFDGPAKTQRLFRKIWQFAISAEVEYRFLGSATPVTELDIVVEDGSTVDTTVTEAL